MGQYQHLGVVLSSLRTLALCFQVKDHSQLIPSAPHLLSPQRCRFARCGNPLSDRSVFALLLLQFFPFIQTPSLPFLLFPCKQAKLPCRSQDALIRSTWCRLPRGSLEPSLSWRSQTVRSARQSVLCARSLWRTERGYASRHCRRSALKKDEISREAREVSLPLSASSDLLFSFLLIGPLRLPSL